jgi:hypothetical protein
VATPHAVSRRSATSGMDRERPQHRWCRHRISPAADRGQLRAARRHFRLCQKVSKMRGFHVCLSWPSPVPHAQAENPQRYSQAIPTVRPWEGPTPACRDQPPGGPAVEEAPAATARDQGGGLDCPAPDHAGPGGEQFVVGRTAFPGRRNVDGLERAVLHWFPLTRTRARTPG